MAPGKLYWFRKRESKWAKKQKASRNTWIRENSKTSPSKKLPKIHWKPPYSARTCSLKTQDCQSSSSLTRASTASSVSLSLRAPRRRTTKKHSKSSWTSSINSIKHSNTTSTTKETSSSISASSARKKSKRPDDLCPLPERRRTPQDRLSAVDENHLEVIHTGDSTKEGRGGPGLLWKWEEPC